MVEMLLLSRPLDSGRLQRAQALVALALLCLLASGCGGSQASQDAQELEAAKLEIDRAVTSREVSAAFSRLFSIAQRASGTPVGDDAFATARDAFRERTAYGTPDSYFTEGTAAPPGWISEPSEETQRARAAIGFALRTPDGYRDEAFSQVPEMFEAIGADWLERLDDVAADRDAWVRDMRRTRKAGGYESFVDRDIAELAYQRELLTQVPEASGLAKAFTAIAAAVAYSDKNQPQSGRTKSTSKSLTAYYSSAEVDKAARVAKSLKSKIRDARDAFEAASR